jgi:hypothetical protein
MKNTYQFSSQLLGKAERKRGFRISIVFSLLFLVLLGCGQLHAADIHSVAGGNWSDPATWGGVSPSWDDHVFIQAYHVVVLDVSAGIRSITNLSNGTLNMGSHTLFIGDGGSFSNNGILASGTSTLHLYHNTYVGGMETTHLYNVIAEGDHVRFEAGRILIKNHLELRQGWIASAPFLDEESTLIYATGGDYDRSVEWNNPWHVVVRDNTLLNLKINSFGSELTARGDLTIGSGSSVFTDIWDQYRIRVSGDINIDGIFTLSQTVGNDLFVGGNWNRTGTFNPSNRLVLFNGPQTQHLTGHTTFNYLTVASGSHLVLKDGITMMKAAGEESAPFVVSAGATLEAGTSIIDGNGSFTLSNGAILITAHPEGIQSTGVSGAVSTATRNYGLNATYHYNGKGNQVSGNGLPHAASVKNIIIELGSDDLTFSFTTGGAVEIQSGGRLEIRSGTVVESTAYASGRQVNGAGDLVMKGGIYRFNRNVAEQVPRLTGTYSDGAGGGLKGTIELAAAGNQTLNAGEKYHNLVFSGSGIKLIPNKTDQISGTVAIHDEAIVNAQNYQLGGAATHLIMTGGRLIMSNTGVAPDMNGKYTLTGGTVEFANSSIGFQTINAGIDKHYYNVDITGTSVANSNASITIQAGGTFTIKSGGLFRIAHLRYIQGAGSFVMEDNSTLQYGHTLGINSSGSVGNIIVTGSRVFSSKATYVMYDGNDQVTGDGLPASVKALKIIKNGSQKVTLSKNLTVTEELHLQNGILVTNNHDLFISSTAPEALTIHSSNSAFDRSYIAGTLKRRVEQTGVDYLFPIGTLADKAQAAAIRFNESKLSGTDVMTVTVGFEPPGEGYYGNLPVIVDDILIDNLAHKGFWRIVSENVSEAQYTLSLRAQGFETINVPGRVRILQRDDDASDWKLAGNTFAYENPAADVFVFRQGNVNGFSEFALGANSIENSLPVEWLYFDATALNAVVQLIWGTASEINNDYFSVQRSADGVYFTELDRLPGAGYSNQVRHYQYQDSDPLAAITYYRISQNDFDGTQSYSKTVAVKAVKRNEGQILVLNNQLHIYAGEGPSNWHYRIFSMQGARVADGIIPAASHLQLDGARWAGQLLIITLTDGMGMITEKVVVNH